MHVYFVHLECLTYFRHHIMNCYLYIVESCSELIQWVDGHTCGLLWRLELGMHSGCGLSPCGDEALVVLDITAAVCELLLTVTCCG